ncbi:non-ribosomal peptide synthetase [Ktedonobacter racemifer]|uniref:Amino acid adenylation domain protein n=1 Tax=Ktedonobacter racemifer DSM 44963 TaxID=485913 RepID=D6TGZ0_KTERA|nr:non-ribosomal peptide synthetase [Ktedonobacter racemifer]EFH88919.1 amino acid adenylation domain protein [Ktedonobacter racemifer DSM 44963]
MLQMNSIEDYVRKLLNSLSRPQIDVDLYRQSGVIQELKDKHMPYWSQVLHDVPDLVALPTDYPRLAVSKHRGMIHSFSFPNTLYEPLKSLSQKENVPLFDILFTAFQTLLFRYTGQEDIITGISKLKSFSSQRDTLGTHFINLLPLRTKISNNSTFQELLRHMHEVILTAEFHSNLPFDFVVDELMINLNNKTHPAFQIFFDLNNKTQSNMISIETPNILKDTSEVASKFDLALLIEVYEDSLYGSLVYNPDLFAATTISRMATHFQTLLGGIVEDHTQPISLLPLLTSGEQVQALLTWNNTACGYPEELCVHQLFEDQVKKTPNACAIVFEHQQLTYHELNQQANQLAHYLQECGVKPETCVGIALERSIDMIVAVLAVFKSGGAYLPLDPRYPSERLAFMLEDAQVSIILTRQDIVKKLPSHNAHFVRMDEDWKTLAQQNGNNPRSETIAHNLAYIIYTSGSTGTPKGVLVSHQSLCNLATAQIQVFHVSPQSRVLQFASLNFDVSISEILMALLAGATLYLGSQEAILPGTVLLHFLQQNAITIATFPPAVLKALPDALLPSLQTIISAGEACSPDIVARWGHNRQFFNAYGPTETTVYATIDECTSRQEKISIGRPIANTQVYILDQEMQIVPVGILGELYIGGAGVARGYLNRPELTKDRFVPHPFSDTIGDQLYKTGDLARYLPDGRIELIGRADRQVKLRGYRIELGEIESALCGYPGVDQTIVMLREDKPSDKRLVAYITVHKEHQVTGTVLRNHLQKRLPDYMLPSSFLFLETIPLTPNNKIDFRALPQPTLDQFERESPFVAPSNDVEKMLVDIWNHVLGVTTIGIHDNFFALGGHSLLATQVLARIRDIFQVDLSFRDFFNGPTIARIAENILTAQKVREWKPKLPLCPFNNRRGVFPLSYAQKRLWFLNQWDRDNVVYSMPMALRLVGLFDASVLQQSLCEIVKRHETLRTVFKMVGGQPMVFVADTTTQDFQLIITDLTFLPCLEEREQAAMNFISQEVKIPFSLSEGPLLRVTLFRLEKEDHVLLINMHHIISDAWSASIFFRELNTLYSAYVQNCSSPLVDLPVQYVDFASWQRQWLQGDLMETQLSYWKQQLSNAPSILQLPTDKPRPSVQSFHGSSHSFFLSPKLTNLLKKLSLKEDCTLFMTLFAAFTILLHRYTAQDDLCIGTPVANRTHTEVEQLIGFFVNTLVLRTKLSSTSTFLELLSNVRDIVLEAYSHQDVPFERLVEEMQPERNSSYHPLVQVMFVLQNAQETSLTLPGVSVHPFEIDNVTSQFDLTLELKEFAGGLQGRFEYNTDLFASSTIKRMIGHFQTLLEDVVEHFELSINDLSILTKDELQQFLLWNTTDKSYPDNNCVHQLFEQQAQKTPDAIAVVFEDQQLTYQELNKKANQLAHYLQGLGIKREISVGVCAERSIELIVGLLGILKAGGIYVPVDPSYPQERLMFMLEEAQVPVVLTQQQFLVTLSFYKHQVICLDMRNENLEHCAEGNPIDTVTCKDLAYIIYTSGSTGRPKGVMIEHKGLLNLIYWHQQTFNVTNIDKSTQIAGPAFDASVWELLPYLTIGASIFIPTEQTRRDVSRLRDWLIEQSITICFLPTPLAERIITITWPRHTSLRFLLTGGDKLRHYPPYGLPFTLVNNYGPTENTVVTTSCTVPIEQDGISPSIGQPISNTRVYLLDHCLRPVPVGVPGELFIGGDGLARGYLNQPSLTDEKFISDPFYKDSQLRLYKTGDIARFRKDGSLEFLGRSDSQVKIRGFRIELGEIEAVLRQHIDVREAIVVAHEENTYGSYLIAYIVLERKLSEATTELRNYLKGVIPDYMLPTVFIFLDTFPLTPNGKVDYNHLPLPNYIDHSSNSALTTPSSPTEEVLATIYAQTLNIEQVDIHANFFEMGGHSLLTTQLVTHIYDTFHVEVPLTQVFDMPTIFEMAQYIEKRLKK